MNATNRPARTGDWAQIPVLSATRKLSSSALRSAFDVDPFGRVAGFTGTANFQGRRKPNAGAGSRRENRR